MISEGELDTLVLGLTEVTILSVITGTLYREFNEQVLGRVDVGIKGTAQLTTEESEVQTDVTSDSGLPFQVRVSHGLGRSPIVADTVHPCGGFVLVNLNELTYRNVVVTGSTEADAEFQVIQPALCTFHERLRRDTPCEGYRGEVTPAVVVTELRATIGTECESCQVTVQVVIVYTSEPRQQLVVCTVRVVNGVWITLRGQFPCCCGIIVHGETVYLVQIDMLLGNHILVTNQHVQRVITVLTEEFLEVIANSIGVAEAMTLGISDTDSRLVLVITQRYILNIILSQTPEALVVIGVIIITELSLHLEVVKDFPTEATCDIQVLTLCLLVTVTVGNQWVVEVTQIIIR